MNKMEHDNKRSKNFTEREKMLLIDIAQEFVNIIDNKKTDGTTVEAKKQAWFALTSKYNAMSETGCRTEKQLHALYDNLKKKARKNISDDKTETYKTGGGTFCPKTTAVDEKIVALLTPQFQPLCNEFDSSAPYYNLDDKQKTNSVVAQPSEDIIVVLDTTQDLDPEPQSAEPYPKRKRSPSMDDILNTPKTKMVCLTETKMVCCTETKKRNINNVSASFMKRKTLKQINEDVLIDKKLQILKLQEEHEKMKLEKSRIIMDLDIELKKVALENAKLDLEFKRIFFNL